ncbi:dynein regulatory complex protein 1 [Gadus morhua]|uniref:Dynein regulatory complex protein 1 n=1 Tax=Gadus morhua TaxID=8049 RepID=A0A8C4YV76_GADMO|nr:dynein regulatory complex protein 1 [Gadus morhua]XP_030200429.1 dynein regulatory complex protein 1 [Gadus morhua]
MSGDVKKPVEVVVSSSEAEMHQERTDAHRLRGAARSTAKERGQRGEDSNEDMVIKDAGRPSEQRAEQSERMLVNLLSEGTQLITNIQVAADAKESQRRTELREGRRLQVEKLECEARSSMEKFEEITRGWSQAKAKVIPQELHQALGRQLQLCAQVLEDKSKLINDLQQELKARDERYVKELKRQAEEVDLMIERMEEQVKTLTRTNREELDHIEKAYEEERKVLLTGNRQEWEQHVKQRSTTELENMMERRRKVEEYEAMLEQLRLAEIDDYNVIREKLETDVQTTQLWKQQQKATAQLNQEKQEFNIHVLMHREKDSMIIQSKLKRKINRLQDVLNSLKANRVQAAKVGHGQCDDYTRTVQQYTLMQKKIKHFEAVDSERFAEVWKMKEEEVRELAERVLDIDRLLHEQQLGLVWERPTVPPELSPSPPRGPATADSAVGPSSRAAGVRSAGAYGEACSDGASSATGDSAGGAAGEGGRGRVSADTVKKLLQLLCDEAGFLIESKLLTLMSSLDKDHQSLIKLDSIFSSLGVESKDDVYRLAEFFSNYQQRPTHQADAEGFSTSSTFDLLHPDEVLAALKAFTAQYRRPRERSAPQHHSSTLTGAPEGPDQAAFWESLANVLPESKLKLWTALDSALEKYHAVLTERSQLFRDTQDLKRQNSELRMLLHQSLNAKVNTELVIPPDRLMKMAPK